MERGEDLYDENFGLRPLSTVDGFANGTLNQSCWLAEGTQKHTPFRLWSLKGLNKASERLRGSPYPLYPFGFGTNSRQYSLTAKEGIDEEKGQKATPS